MRVFIAITLAAAVLGVPSGFAVEPAYQGQFGNNEEPATRPYKWLYRGLKSLVFHTGDQLVEGNMHTPVLGSVQGLRGLRRGTVELGESLFNGGVYAPAPPAGHYKEIGRLNTLLEDDILLRNSSDLLFSWYFFPAQKFVDYYPLEGDTKVEIRQNEAREIRDVREEAAAARSIKDEQEERIAPESDVKRAQRAYIGERADYGAQKTDKGRGNLMKLAR